MQNAKLVLYADDTNILEAWLFGNELVLNTAETCAMLFHSSQQKCVNKPNIMYNNTGIAYCPNINSWVLLSLKTENGMPILIYYATA